MYVPFTYKGDQITSTQTPGDLDMKDGDVIDVAIQMDRVISIKVRDHDGSEVFFKIKNTSRLRKLMDVYAQRKGDCLPSSSHSRVIA